MKNNTVVIACAANYYWGAFQLLSSMRCHHMDEPVLIFGQNFTDKQKETLNRFGDVHYVEAPADPRSMTCRKGEAMLHADNEFITWVDCDGFFTGNCSAMLPPPSPDEIHVRLRSSADNRNVFRNAHLYSAADKPGDIPKSVLDTWQKDVNDSAVPREKTCVSACILSVHRSQRAFLERWQSQMNKCLPKNDVGVVNAGIAAYYQLDESVLNSLLCFDTKAPKITAEFQLNKDPAACFRHFVGRPKPWQWWTTRTFPCYDDFMAGINWSLQQHFTTREELPFCLTCRSKAFLKLCTVAEYGFRLKQKIKTLAHR